MSSVTIQELLYRIAADSRELDKELRKSNRNVDRSTKKSKRAFKHLESDTLQYVKRMTRAFAALAGAAAIGTFIKRTIDSADAVGKVSEKLGIAVEEYGKLQYAAELTGVANNQLEMALQRMTRRVAEAAQETGEAQEALNTLQLDAKELAGLSPDEIFKRIADRMETVSDQGERVRLAFKLFDSEGVNLVRTLNLGRQGLKEAGDEAERLGLIIDRNTALQAAEFNDNLKRMRGLATGLANRLIAETIPALNTLADTYSTVDAAGNRASDSLDRNVSLARQLAEGTVVAVKGLEGLVHLFDVLKATSDLVSVIGERKFSSLTDLYGAMTGRLPEFLKATDAAVNYLKELDDLITDLAANRQVVPAVEIPGIRPSGRSGASEYGSKEQKELDRLYASEYNRLLRSKELHGQVTEEQRILYEIEKGRLKGLDSERQEVILKLARERDQIVATAEAEQKRKEAEKALYEEVQRFRDLAIGDLQKLQQEAAKLTAFWQAGLITQEEYIANLYRIQQAAQDLADKTVESNEIMVGAARQVGAELQQTFADLFFIPFEEGLEGMVKGFIDAMRRILANALAMAFLKALFPPGSTFGDILFPAAGKAAGGPIRGPGTSTSDSIPIRASDGEYMVRAAAVDKYGQAFLDSINSGRFPHVEPFTAPPRPKLNYADGGLVQSLQQGGEFAVRVGIFDDRKPLDDFLDSAEFDSAVARSYVRRGRQMQALARGRR